jgi:D-glycero-alpha-D-manno-heptose 1-phosphate guanylyltransferase
LRDVLGETPKSLASIGGPFLNYQLLWLRKAGVRDVVLCVGHKHAQIQEYAGKGDQWRLNISYSLEDKPLGTAGAVKNAESLIPRFPILVLNGDSFLQADLAALVEFHQKYHATASLALARVPMSSRYGSVRLDSEDHILAFSEKTSTTQESPGTLQLVNGGLYVFSEEVLRMIAAGKAVSLEQDIFPQLAGERLFGYTNTGYFIDIGVPEDYQRAQRELPSLDL